MSLEVITASFDHLPELAPLFDAYRVFYGQASDVEAARAHLQERFTLGESIVFIAMLEVGTETRAVGFTQLYPMFSSVSLRRIWILNDLYVVSDFRGQRRQEELVPGLLGRRRAGRQLRVGVDERELAELSHVVRRRSRRRVLWRELETHRVATSKSCGQFGAPRPVVASQPVFAP